MLIEVAIPRLLIRIIDGNITRLLEAFGESIARLDASGDINNQSRIIKLSLFFLLITWYKPIKMNGRHARYRIPDLGA